MQGEEGREIVDYRKEVETEGGGRESQSQRKLGEITRSWLGAIYVSVKVRAMEELHPSLSKEEMNEGPRVN